MFLERKQISGLKIWLILVVQINTERKSVFIGVMTGNWIRLRRTKPRGPVPLARGGVSDDIESIAKLGTHLKFKQTLVNKLDEIFVIAPLGKVWSGVDVDYNKVNEVFGYEEDPEDPEKKAYNEVKIDNESAPKVKLVTTSRPDDFLLHTYSNQVRNFLALSPNETPNLKRFINSNIQDMNHLVFDSDRL